MLDLRDMIRLLVHWLAAAAISGMMLMLGVLFLIVLSAFATIGIGWLLIVLAVSLFSGLIYGMTAS